MARYTGPKTRISRKFGELITGNGKWLTKNSNPPGMHGGTKKRKTPSEYAIKLSETRLDNTVYRMGISISRQGARQLVSHKHITVNGEVLNIPSYSCQPGDVIGLKNKSAANKSITGNLRGKNPKFGWIEWSEAEMKG